MSTKNQHYIITDGNIYVGHPVTRSIASSRKLAYKWTNETKASNVLHAILQNKKGVGALYRNRNMLHIEKYEDINSAAPSVKKNVNLDDLLDVLENVHGKLDSKREKLSNDLSKCDLTISDINHYREKNPRRSASARCKLDVFETSVLTKRRKIKYELYKTDRIIEMMKQDASFNENEYCVESYKPRLLQELFDNNEIPSYDDWVKDNFMEE